MAARILVVEDDPVLLKILEAAIEYGGFESRSVVTGDQALAVFDAGTFDAILLDLGLPDYDGGDLLKRLRAKSNIPIIVVSGRGSERDKIDALDLGADDFVPKPFLPGELLARIRAALRRYASGQHVSGAAPDPERSPMRLGNMVLDPFFKTIGCGGNEAVLNEGEYKVLRLLATRADEIVSRDEILRMLYGEEHPEATKIVEVYISNIRRKLREVTSGGEFIANARGKGWILRTPA
jgi:two-component system KDP operon response regulator KdpE